MKISDAEFIPNEDETMEIEIIPQKKIRVSRDHETEEQFSLGNLQLQFGRKLEYLEEEIKNKPEIVTNVDLCKGQRSPNPSRPSWHRTEDSGGRTVRKSLMKAIEGAFGIKKLITRALSDNRPWKEKIKVVGGKYTCIKDQVHKAHPVEIVYGFR